MKKRFKVVPDFPIQQFLDNTNARNISRLLKEESLSAIIASAFVWSSSEEGTSFWDNWCKVTRNYE